VYQTLMNIMVMASRLAHGQAAPQQLAHAPAKIKNE
jgi:hypothetical protein